MHRGHAGTLSRFLRHRLSRRVSAGLLMFLSAIDLLLVGIELSEGTTRARPAWLTALETGTVVAIAAIALTIFLSLRSEISERRRLEQTAHRRQRFLSEFSQQIRAILRSASDPEAELQAMAPFLAKGLARLLDVERCGIWLFSEDGEHLDELVTWQRSEGRLESGSRLERTRHRAYFEALESGRALIATDARTHPATRDFGSNYLAPLGITAMLDAPLMREGRLVGAICAEHRGGIRRWKNSEIGFLASSAEILSLGFEAAETVRLRRQADRLREEAERSDQAKSRFIASMSHELRTPLNAILGFTSTLLAEPEKCDERTREYLSFIAQGGADLLEIINEILDLARAEHGKLEAAPVELSPDWLIERAVLTITPQAEKAGVEIEIARPGTLSWSRSQDGGETPPDEVTGSDGEGTQKAETPSPEILADPKFARQALVNILGNAIKISSRGGRVRIGGCRHGMEYDILVVDSGAGMTMQELTAALEPFNQLDRDPYVRSDGGLGLGLTLTKSFMEAQGGALILESLPGQGTCARLRFPLAE